MKPNIYILTGPTACGKTAVSIELAKKMDGEIISADAIQLYKGLDIGSAKPTLNERQGIAHHLMDCIEPTEPRFTVACFRTSAYAAATDIVSRGKNPLVVGGTGLYVNALTYPLTFSNVPPNEALRAQLAEKELADRGALHRLLEEKDPATAARLHINDTKRIIRALEICIESGKKASEQGEGFAHRDDEALPFAPVIAALNMPRKMLYKRIESRVDAMFEQGLVDEVQALLQRGCGVELPAMQGLGYKETIAYLQGSCTLEEAKEVIKKETRHFAKRQLTWFRRDGRIRWFDVCEHDCSPEKLAQAILVYYKDGGKNDE